MGLERDAALCTCAVNAKFTDIPGDADWLPAPLEIKEKSALDIPPLVTVSRYVDEALGLKFLSPLYTAERLCTPEVKEVGLK